MSRAEQGGRCARKGLQRLAPRCTDGVWRRHHRPRTSWHPPPRCDAGTTGGRRVADATRAREQGVQKVAQRVGRSTQLMTRFGMSQNGSYDVLAKLTQHELATRIYRPPERGQRRLDVLTPPQRPPDVGQRWLLLQGGVLGYCRLVPVRLLRRGDPKMLEERWNRTGAQGVVLHTPRMGLVPWR